MLAAPAMLHLLHGGLRLPVPEQMGLIQAALAATMLPGAGPLVVSLALLWPGRRGPTRHGLDPRGWII